MSTIIKRQSIALTKNDIRQLDELKTHLGENVNQIYKRALTLLYEKEITSRQDHS